jgi:adenylate kinase
MKIVLLGPPGSGKGTQGDHLVDRCEIPRYATGDMLREAVRRDTPLGREAKRYMDDGELVPDQVVLGLVREVLASPTAESGFILDGFPRTLAQARGLEAILDERGMSLDAVIYLDVPEDELVRRLSGRRVCTACGAVYNVYTDAPSVAGQCDRCGKRLEIREDDKEETVRNRLRVYRESTEPVLEWYRGRSTSMLELKATGSVAEVRDRLLSALDCS